MSNHSRNSSSSSGEDDNKIEYIGGTHHSGERFLELKWEVYYFASYGLDRDALKNLLEERFGHRGYALSLIGISTYQLWTPMRLTQVRYTFDASTCCDWLANQYLLRPTSTAARTPHHPRSRTRARTRILPSRHHGVTRWTGRPQKKESHEMMTMTELTTGAWGVWAVLGGNQKV